MVDLALVALVFLAVVAVGAAAMLGVTAVVAWAATRLATTALVAGRSAVAGAADVGAVELRIAGLRALDYVDAGVVTAVVPERRWDRPGDRSGRGRFRPPTRRDGVRFDLALGTPDDRRGAVWVPLPDRLTGASRLERVTAACGVEPDRLSDAVGTELPLVRDGDGRFRVDRNRSPVAVGPVREACDDCP